MTVKASSEFLSTAQVEFLKATKYDTAKDIDFSKLFRHILCNYTGTLNSKDQRCLEIFHVLEQKNLVDFEKFYPVCWSQFAKSVYIEDEDKVTLDKRSVNDILQNNIDNDVMLVSSSYLPLDISIEKYNYETKHKIYDPRFFLPMFDGFFDDNSTIDCKLFIKTNCMSYVFACLSLKDDRLRKCAYNILAKFRHFLTLQSVKFSEKSIILHLLTTLKNSIDKPNQRMPFLIANFLGKSSWVLLNSKHKLYKPICNYVLVKPTLDLKDVPEFYKLFHSSSADNYKVERIWILQLIKDGMIFLLLF